MNDALAEDRELSALEKLPDHGPLPPLEVGDIILVHTKHDIGRSIFRKVTNSYWNHTGLILYPRGFEGAQKDLYAEGLHGRFRLHTLDHLLNHPELYDIGIKRVPNLSFEMQRRIIGLTLLSLDVRTVRHRFIGTKYFLALYLPWLKNILFARPYRSSTSFVQTIYLQAADWKDKASVAFQEYLASPLETQSLITPKEIAHSPRCTWIYNKKH